MIVHLSEVGYVYEPSAEKKDISGLRVVGFIEHPKFTLCGLNVYVNSTRKPEPHAHKAVETVADLNHPSTCQRCVRKLSQKKAHGLQPVYLPSEMIEALDHAAE